MLERSLENDNSWLKNDNNWLKNTSTIGKDKYGLDKGMVVFEPRLKFYGLVH